MPMGRIRSRPNSRPACIALARPGLHSTHGPQLLWPGDPRLRDAPERGARDTRARRRGMHARRRRALSVARRLHRRGRVAGYELEWWCSTLTERRPRQRCSTHTAKQLQALCWAMKCGEEGGVRRRPTWRRTWHHDAAYRTEAMGTSGWSCRNGGRVRRRATLLGRR
jgi:hypothetical protein